MGRASVSESCSVPDCACSCNQQPIDDSAFWEELVSQLISIVCLIEREKLDRITTTSQLRRAGKDVLCQKRET